MPFRPVLLTFCALALSVLLSTGGHAQEQEKIDMKTGGAWPHLARYIGTYDYDELLKDKAVRAAIAKVLREKSVDLQTEMDVKSPIGFEGDCLILQGNRQHQADTRRAYMEACIFEGIVNIALFEDGKVTVYSDTTEYKYLTGSMRTWIYFQNNNADLYKQPEQVEFAK